MGILYNWEMWNRVQCVKLVTLIVSRVLCILVNFVITVLPNEKVSPRKTVHPVKLMKVRLANLFKFFDKKREQKKQWKLFRVFIKPEIQHWSPGYGRTGQCFPHVQAFVKAFPGLGSSHRHFSKSITHPIGKVSTFCGEIPALTFGPRALQLLEPWALHVRLVEHISWLGFQLQRDWGCKTCIHIFPRKVWLPWSRTQLQSRFGENVGALRITCEKLWGCHAKRKILRILWKSCCFRHTYVYLSTSERESFGVWTSSKNSEGLKKKIFQD